MAFVLCESIMILLESCTGKFPAHITIRANYFDSHTNSLVPLPLGLRKHTLQCTHTDINGYNRPVRRMHTARFCFIQMYGTRVPHTSTYKVSLARVTHVRIYVTVSLIHGCFTRAHTCYTSEGMSVVGISGKSIKHHSLHLAAMEKNTSKSSNIEVYLVYTTEYLI